MTLKSNNESVVPEHYQQDGQDLLSHLEHIFSEDEMRGAYRFNIMKYTTRAGRKDDITLEIDKIIQYAKRWKQFEESKESSSPDHKEGDFETIFQFTSRHYDGEEILSCIDWHIKDDDTCRLTLAGEPAWIDGNTFIVPSNEVVTYSKEQLTTFFKEHRKDKFTGLEILVKKQKG